MRSLRKLSVKSFQNYKKLNNGAVNKVEVEVAMFRRRVKRVEKIQRRQILKVTSRLSFKWFLLLSWSSRI